MAALVEQGRLVQEGRARASRYRVPECKGMVADAETAEGLAFRDEAEARLPVSGEGREIRQIVRGPLQHREPVGYRREFLDQYRPNHGFYLSEALRQRLFALGQPAGTYTRHIWNRLLIDLSWNSSRLEGNTCSLLETERLLALGEAADGKDALEAQMLLNHKAAIELLVDQTEDTGLDRYTVLNLHEGNMACYRIRPSEYADWRKRWK